MPELWITDGAQRFLPPLFDLRQHKRMFVTRLPLAGYTTPATVTIQ